jgi:predicted ribosomally synthesized peptide with SipW-like signal peptide
MKKILISLSIIGAVAAIAIGSTVAYFRDVETSTGNTMTAGTLDLKIRDQDEAYRDGVTATWIATDVKPGNEYAFLVPFVQLAKTYDSIAADHLEITTDYTVIEEVPCLESDTDCQTDLHPDAMAKEMLVTRCVYKEDARCIDCLTGKRFDGYDPINGVCVGSVLETRNDWKIEDQIPLDGKISFYDLKNDKLDNLPPVTNLMTPQFEMGVKFAETAGNDFQGDTFDLTMIFTLNQDASQ